MVMKFEEGHEITSGTWLNIGNTQPGDTFYVKFLQFVEGRFGEQASYSLKFESQADFDNGKVVLEEGQAFSIGGKTCVNLYKEGKLKEGKFYKIVHGGTAIAQTYKKPYIIWNFTSITPVETEATVRTNLGLGTPVTQTKEPKSAAPSHENDDDEFSWA